MADPGSMGEKMDVSADFWLEETQELMSAPLKLKRRARPKKMEFAGWGSKPLVEFLESIGRDTSSLIPRLDVLSIINDYIKTHNLIDPQKKKKVLCDERLYYLFGKKSVGRIQIYDLLANHFAENQNDSDDEYFYSSAEDDNNPAKFKKQQKGSSLDRKVIRQNNEVPEIPKSCFAAIIPANIKLLYLKKSLVQDLLKHPETFDAKVIGSFVRIRSDPNDYLQKNTHQLLQVIGVAHTSTADDIRADTRLQVSNVMKDVRICMLSDDNFSEEECEDLRHRVKSGSQKRPTVVEFQQKAKMLHEDITKHWLARELNFLQNRIDQANEKGWRKELFEYLERKQLLQTPAEQSRLLHEVPEVIADEVEQEDGPTGSAISISGAALKVSTSELDPNTNLVLQSIPSADAADVPCLPQSILGGSSLVSKEIREFVRDDACNKEPKEDNHVLHGTHRSLEENRSSQKLVGEQVSTTQVIVVSDDDKEAEEDCNVEERICYDHQGGSMWHYIDPFGEVQGPFSLELLHAWSDGNYFNSDFRVWRTGQNPDEAVLLTHLLAGVPSDSP